MPGSHAPGAPPRPMGEALLLLLSFAVVLAAIGLDVHERPFLSVEDETVLEAGMTFTDEPSILIDGRFGVRIEDVIVCAEPAARYVNEYSRAPVVN